MIFCDCASVFNTYVAEMTFSHVYVLNVLFVALYLVNEIRGRASDVMLMSLFVGREKKYKTFL